MSFRVIRYFCKYEHTHKVAVCMQIGKLKCPSYLAARRLSHSWFTLARS
jgi:hypothetical protein